MQAIKKSDHAAATEEKTFIEDRQRDETAKRAEQGIEWQPRLFRKVHGGPGGSEEGEEALDWILNANMYVIPSQSCPISHESSDGPDPEAKTKQILAITPILKGQPTHQQPSQNQHQQPPQSQQQSVGHADLIDFGQSTSNPISSVPPRNSSMHQTVQQHASSSLQEPMQPEQPLKRVDTLTKDVDEFVDAPAP